MKKPSALNQKIHAQLLELLSGEPTSHQLNLSLRLLAKWRSRLIENTAANRGGHTIKHGPFTGMNYGVPASEGGGAPRLMGVYETSLAPVIDDIVAGDPALIIDVGCAEGYYAVGLARRLPNATIWARDTDARARQKCRDLAEMNGVADRVEVGGTMTHADFDICLRHKSVVVCDIEGAEIDLLQPTLARGLYAADILVECHPAVGNDVAATIKDRFALTHDIVQLDRKLDDEGLPQWMQGSSDLDRLLALWEWRSTPTPWLWMTAKPANQ